MIRINKWILFFFAFGLSLVSSCVINSENKEAIYYDFDDKDSNLGLEVTFYPFEETYNIQHNKIYSVSLSVRYSNLCLLKYIPFKVEYSSLDQDSIKEKNIIVPLYDDEGTREGKGHLGIYESEVSLLVKQPYENGFFITVSSPEINTEGILSLGVILEPVAQQM